MAKHTRECSFVRSRSLCLRIVAVMGRRYCPPLHGNSKSFLLRHLLTNSFTRTYTYHGHWRSALGTHGFAALDNFVEWSRSRTVLWNWDNMRVVVAVVDWNSLALSSPHSNDKLSLTLSLLLIARRTYSMCVCLCVVSGRVLTKAAPS